MSTPKVRTRTGDHHCELESTNFASDGTMTPQSDPSETGLHYVLARVVMMALSRLAQRMCELS